MIKKLTILLLLFALPVYAGIQDKHKSVIAQMQGVVQLTGSAEAITWAAGADPAGQSITIPADATAVYMFWTYWADSDGAGLATATLNSVSRDAVSELPISTGPGMVGTGVAVWYSCCTGSQTLDIAWDVAPTEGPTTIVVYVKGGNLSAWRDVDTDQNTDANAVTVTIDSTTNDLVLKYDGRIGATAPGLSASWTNTLIQENIVTYSARLSSADTSGAATTVCNSENESYSTIICVSVPKL